RRALEETGKLMVHSHFGGRFMRKADGTVERETSPVRPPGSDWPTFLRLAGEIVEYRGHIGYELCSPVLTGHRHAGLDYALLQAELACRHMKRIIGSL
ncbi:unnamed protein product, partial [marine sediment metagenome]